MTKTISLTIPNDDPVALRAFGDALEQMAVAYGAPVTEMRGTVSAMTMEIDGTKAAQAVRDVLSEFTPPSEWELEPLSEDTEQIGETTECPGDNTCTDPGCPHHYAESEPKQPPVESTVDADGLPWDARIHSASRDRNADNTWRARRKPKDFTPEQWAAEVEQVREELKALMAIPVQPVSDDEQQAAHEALTAELGCDPAYYTDESPAAAFGSDEPAIVPLLTVEPALVPPPVMATEAEPPVVVPPPVIVPPPVAASGIPATIAELMTWLTKHAPADDEARKQRLEKINAIVANHGLVALGQLQNRSDLIPQIYADMVKEFGV